MYSISNLTLIADCDALLAIASKEKADLVYKKISDERVTVRYAETAQELDILLQGVLVELSATETIIAVLPEGPTKEEAKYKKIRLDYKKFVLENRKKNYGSVALLEKEMELARINSEIEEVDTFISVVEAHKATLAA